MRYRGDNPWPGPVGVAGWAATDRSVQVGPDITVPCRDKSVRVHRHRDCHQQSRYRDRSGRDLDTVGIAIGWDAPMAGWRGTAWHETPCSSCSRDGRRTPCRYWLE